MLKDWWKESASGIPNLITEIPGPKSRVMHENTAKYMKGLSSQVKLFPVCFEEGAYRDFHGKTLGVVSCAQMYRGETYSYGPNRTLAFF